MKSPRIDWESVIRDIQSRIEVLRMLDEALGDGDEADRLAAMLLAKPLEAIGRFARYVRLPGDKWDLPERANNN